MISGALSHRLHEMQSAFFSLHSIIGDLLRKEFIS